MCLPSEKIAGIFIYPGEKDSLQPAEIIQVLRTMTNWFNKY